MSDQYYYKTRQLLLQITSTSYYSLSHLLLHYTLMIQNTSIFDTKHVSYYISRRYYKIMQYKPIQIGRVGSTSIYTVIRYKEINCINMTKNDKNQVQ